VTAWAERVLAAAGALTGTRPVDLLYARVDALAPAAGDDGEPTLMELELVEPSLFLAHDDGAADRLAAEAVRLLDGSA